MRCMQVSKLNGLCGAVCAHRDGSTHALRVHTSRTAGCLQRSVEMLHSVALRAAPLLSGLVGKSGHKQTPPFSLHLSLQSPLSCCLLAPSICRPLFVLCQTYVYERERQREMHGCILCLYIDLISACLSSLIAFHPSPPSSLTAFFPISPSLRSYL